MKQCTRCSKIYNNSFFRFKNKAKGLRSSACKFCTRAMSKQHYKNDPVKHMARGRAYKLNNKQLAKDYVLEYLKTHPCIVCGETDILVLVFDHIDPDTKKAAVGTMRMRGSSLEAIKTEIAKCQVLCCNCHTRRTAIQFNWWKSGH